MTESNFTMVYKKGTINKNADSFYKIVIKVINPFNLREYFHNFKTNENDTDSLIVETQTIQNIDQMNVDDDDISIEKKLNKKYQFQKILFITGNKY